MVDVKRLMENDAKTDIKTSKRHLDIMHKSRLTLPVLDGNSLYNPVTYLLGMQEMNIPDSSELSLCMSIK